MPAKARTYTCVRTVTSERVMHFIRRQLVVNRAFKRIACHCDCVSTAVIGSGLAGAASQTQL